MLIDNITTEIIYHASTLNNESIMNAQQLKYRAKHNCQWKVRLTGFSDMIQK